MKDHVTDDLRQEMAINANFRCEYCLIPEFFLASTFHVDHIRSRKHGGKTLFLNLAYTCPHCNQHKGTDVATFIDDENDETVRLFNPRKDHWQDHFYIDEGEILPKTPIGNATVKILQLNQVDRVILRKELVAIGIYDGF
jgi:hypothetical protein